jgi:hypothetical protein
MEEYNKYSENAKEAISKIIENTSNDMISKMVQYIGGSRFDVQELYKKYAIDPNTKKSIGNINWDMKIK